MAPCVRGSLVDGLPMLRKGDTGDWIGTFQGHKGAVWSATLARDATRAATGAADFTAKVWNVETGDETVSFSHKHIVKSVDFSCDGSRLLTGSNEKLLRIFDLARPDAEPATFEGHTSNIRSALWKHDGLQIYSASDDKTLRLWDVSSRQCVKTLSFNSAPSSLELTHDGATLVVTTENKVQFYDTSGMTLRKEFVTPSQVNTASYLPDRSLFVCGGEDFKVYKYDYETGEELESVKGHFGQVHCVHFSPDGEIYASGSEDGTLRLWQTVVGKTYGLWKYVEPDEVTENGAAAPTASTPALAGDSVVSNGPAASLAAGMAAVKVEG